MIYLIPRPQDRIQKRGRETGWRHIKLDRDGRKELQGRVQSLRDKGITAVYVADLDIDAGEIVRDELHCLVRSEFPLRRFNVGRHHAADRSIVDGIIRQVAAKWEKNPDIPVRSGDSLTSFKKRFIRRYEQLVAQDATVAMIVDERTLSVIRDLSQNKFTSLSLAPNGNAPKMDRIYKVENVPRPA